MQIQLDPITISCCSLAVAMCSLCLAAWGAWFNQVNRGRLRMTRPSLIVLKHDRLADDEILPKIFVRTLLFTTGNRGHIIQSMYLRLRRAESTQNFSVWGHGPTNELKFGAGLRVTPDGVDHNHHFNPPNGTGFDYAPGDYKIAIIAEVAGQARPIVLGEIVLTITQEQSERLKADRNAELYFEWGPDSNSYISHIHTRQMPAFLGLSEQAIKKKRMISDTSSSMPG